MKSENFFFIVGLLFFIFLVQGIRTADAVHTTLSTKLSEVQKPIDYTLFLDIKVLEHNRQNLPKNHPALIRLRKEAEKALSTGPFSVTQKTRLPPGDNIHDFCDLSPYFWPNPWLPGGRPYIFRDGRVNPEADSEAYDRKRYFDFVQTMQTLSLGYYFTGDQRFAVHAADLMRVWFVNPDTTMTPNFNHSQVIPGLTDGFSLGVIRGTELIQILDALTLIQKSGAWSDKDQAVLVQWLKKYYSWARGGEFGQIESHMWNNHGTWYDAQIAALALYLGYNDAAREILSDARYTRIVRQIQSDGSQPYELGRTRSRYYAIYNLKGLCILAQLADHAGLDLWSFHAPDGIGLSEAFDWLLPYEDGSKQWEYKQIIRDPYTTQDWFLILSEIIQHQPKPEYKKALKEIKNIDVSERIRLLAPVL